jgi:hypothetical protein
VFGSTGRNGHDHYASHGVLADKPLSSRGVEINDFAAQYVTSTKHF